MATYATAADLDAYMEGGHGLGTAAEANAVIERAERDLDNSVLIPIEHQASPLRYDVTLLDTQDREALRRATCAQAEYRLAKGPGFFIERQFPVGEFASTSMREPRIGPKVWEEISHSAVALMSGRLV